MMIQQLISRKNHGQTTKEEVVFFLEDAFKNNYIDNKLHFLTKNYSKIRYYLISKEFFELLLTIPEHEINQNNEIHYLIVNKLNYNHNYLLREYGELYPSKISNILLRSFYLEQKNNIFDKENCIFILNKTKLYLNSFSGEYALWNITRRIYLDTNIISSLPFELKDFIFNGLIDKFGVNYVRFHFNPRYLSAQQIKEIFSPADILIYYDKINLLFLT